MADTSAPTTEARRAQLAALAAMGLAVLAGWLLLGGGLQRLVSVNGGPATTGDLGQPAPEFTLDRISGTPVRLADYRGKVVLLNFWATWCVPCRAEMPEIEMVYRAEQARGFEVLAVNVQENEALVDGFQQELGLTFPALLDRDGSVARRYLARALPSSFLVDRQGIVKYIRVGPLTQGQLQGELNRAGL